MTRDRGILSFWSMVIIWIGLFAGGNVLSTRARPFTRPIEGIRAVTPRVVAITHARIIVRPGHVLEDATLVVRDGRIVAVGTRVDIPADAVQIDYTGKTISPGWIDAYAPQLLRKNAYKDWKSSYWNERVRAELRIGRDPEVDPKKIQKYRKAGFAAALVVPNRGIFRGQSTLMLLGEGDVRDQIVRADVAQHVAFAYRFSFFRQEQPKYPTSLMGAIALIRQVLYDAQWYRDAQAVHARFPATPRPEHSEALAALVPVIERQQPIVFAVTDEWNFLRAARIVREFGLRAIIRGSGQEYQRLDRIRETGLPIIVPVNFPEAPRVEDPAVAMRISLSELMHWDRAPDNPRMLAEAGVRFALTADGLKDVTSFRKHVLRAVRRGLDRDTALAALTTVPAELLGVADRLGSLEPGKIANFLVSDGHPLDDNATLQEIWIEGRRYALRPRPAQDPRGTWQLTVTYDTHTVSRTLVIEGQTPTQLKAHIRLDGEKTDVRRVTYRFGRIVLVIPGHALGAEQDRWVQLSGAVFADTFQGGGFWTDGRPVRWKAVRTPDEGETMDETSERQRAAAKEREEDRPIAPILYPFGAYGRKYPVPPQPEYVLVRNATIWTNTERGILEGADLLIHRGKIEAVGRNLKPPAHALVIDATGKHVTPGLIDAHSHTAIAGGVNEVGQAITAEVRIRDVINPEDINIYRELAGGLTVAHLLHGSANPIGGQSQVIKLRWGGDAETLIFREAPPTIKFALGENPKQSNWGDRFTTRYPQTRMGVEQIIRDRFKMALDYQRRWEAYRKAKPKDRAQMMPPRRDLEMDALVEILKGVRKVHAHSYRQDEILMLMRLAESFGFRIQCFQHVLEGYKVADVLARHGAGASTFSDWWAYKFEVYDAIPYNGALMWSQGVVVSFNSDSSELARRLNWEAAKAVKYGGVPETEALKFVTLNPAIQLGVERFVGSLEPGKDADFVIWSGHPFAPDTHAEQTWIDGRKYFDRAEDLERRQEMRELRQRLIAKALKVRKKQPDFGKKGQHMPPPREIPMDSCLREEAWP